jgi:hypothetical protein
MLKSSDSTYRQPSADFARAMHDDAMSTGAYDDAGPRLIVFDLSVHTSCTRRVLTI